MGARTVLITALLTILIGLNVYQYLGTPGIMMPGEVADTRSREAVKQSVLAALRRDEVRDLFQRLFNREKKVMRNKWFGVTTLQHPFDAWIQQEIIFEIKPDFIVETGTFQGGSAGLWATILEHANPDGRVISIDIEDKRSSAHRSLPIVKRRVDFLLGSAIDPTIVQEVAKRVQGKKVLVILDDAKSPQHILAELKAYAPIVSVGSYVIVQGTHLGYRVPQWNGPAWAPGAFKGVQMFMATTDEFMIDHSREALIATESPSGFLRRIR